ncbi:MAG: bifunctional UDP-3-O-[3-hydroxymyristoyl] N-acetylglucosamine deacetylase/3-hydroxyacyl-ACP dehydratase [Bacteroidota bacterium]|nr:bifunctional UDP-3-O-[3-hydroxymyristoyl] N-acetylglucosamine deacetylase/3-hydroxyacyl-ACP dehydratase [Bacteroidota bacterium]
MNSKQQTIKNKVTVSGVGLHTGEMCNMSFVPQDVNFGIKFQRVDLPGQPIVEADVDHVVDISRGTTIEKNGARIYTVEHTLAALTGLEIDNILIQMDGPEPPIMDGSSLAFVNTLTDTGVVEQNALRNYFIIPENIRYVDPARSNVELAALPLDDYRVTVMVDYNSPVLGSQHASITDIKQFAKEIAGCRTFCFLHELEMLKAQNLIKGGDLNNAIVIVDRVVKDEELESLAKLFNLQKVEVKKEGILNNVTLRYNNEPARHKLLDVIGDLTLVGRPLKAQILAARPGHAANVAFAKKLKKVMMDSKNSAPHYDPTAPPVYDVKKVYNILPHSYPFKLIDKIIHIEETLVVGVKNVTINEPFFMGHFNDNPVFPGVYQIEGMAQTGGVLALETVDDPQNYWAYFLAVENCRFRRMIVPGDTIIFRCELLAPIKRGIIKMQGQAFVAGELACEAVMTASIVRKPGV